ncbi:putative g-patch dna repair protein [Phaeomoniella chlamydospora]|uniref:Putative g-patch dna repair protein n=1 Tax=Phaeomoniella chlamydospora TaxID=158046 RepID=A0A0G2GZU1_PHACM|nr:putative g-patch dna repair protein [Phaeomoniella chlamydospora]
MAPASDSKPSKGGLTSLYANLLGGDPAASAPGTISSAPVTYKQTEESAAEQDEAARKQQALAGRSSSPSPQLQAQKAKAKAIAAKFSQPQSTTTPPAGTSPAAEAEKPESSTFTQTPAFRTTLADWTGDDDANDYYGAERRQRGGRKKRKKNKAVEEVPQNWDDIYDPSRPNNYEEYKNSDEKIREIMEWKDRLYAHRIKRRFSSDYTSDEDDRRHLNNQFAPPPMSFAPPKSFDDVDNGLPPPPPPSNEIPDDPTGDDAYARRMRLSQPQQPSQPPPPITKTPSQPPPGQISRAPVRYNLPSAPPDIPASEAELEAALASESPADSGPATPSADDEEGAHRSKRPGQAGFAERLMAKYGWTKGTGLGASGTGIVNPLYAKIDKRKKKSDAEGGGFATPAGHGKILGGHKDKKGQAEDQGKLGKMSEVIKLNGMLRGLDLDEELHRAEGGGLMQDIGQECSEKYGTVERIYIHREESGDDGPSVFVKFTSQLSALRAVNALEGRPFAGNMIQARFWEKDQFDDGVYE